MIEPNIKRNIRINKPIAAEIIPMIKEDKAKLKHFLEWNPGATSIFCS